METIFLSSELTSVLLKMTEAWLIMESDGKGKERRSANRGLNVHSDTHEPKENRNQAETFFISRSGSSSSSRPSSQPTAYGTIYP